MAAKSERPKMLKATFYLEPEQVRALRDEAVKRMQAAGIGKPDASAVLREILAPWVKRRSK